MTVKTKCVTRIKEQLGDKFTRAEIDEVVQALIDEAEGGSKVVGSLGRQLKLAARNLSEDELKAARQERIQRARNIIKRKQLTTTLLDGARDGDYATEFTRLTVGRTKLGEGDGLSQDAGKHQLEGTWIGGLVADLEEAGVADMVRGTGLLRRTDEKLDLDVRVEMRRLDGAAEAPTGNHNAVKIAGIYNKWIEVQRLELNSLGAYISKIEGYAGTRTHDPHRISQAGIKEAGVTGVARTRAERVARHNMARKNWIDYVMPRLDERTFVGVKDRVAYLSRVFDNLSSGNFLKKSSKEFDGGFPFFGAGNLAKKLSHARKLHFKDALAEHDYNLKFGTGSLFENVTYALRSAAQDASTLRTWGTNPEGMWTEMISNAIERAKTAGDTAQVHKLEGGLSRTSLVPTLRAQFEAATGIADIPGNPTIARFMSAVRMFTAMTKLGGMVLSSLPDIATRASVMRRNGISFTAALADGVASIARGRGGPEIKRAMATMGIGIDGTLGAAYSRFTAVDNAPGRMSRMMGHFFRLNLSSWWQDAMMTGSGLMLSKNLALQVGSSFDQLHAGLRATLKSYGIEQADWDVMRASQIAEIEGERLLHPEFVTDAKVRAKLETYYIEQARESMTMGGAAEKAWITNFGQAGSPGGEMARFFLQFKNYPLTFARRHLIGGVRRGDYGGVAQLIVMSTILGYASTVAKDLAKGREPRDPFDVATVGAAFVQGGGLGIYGDFLLGEYDRFGRSLGQTLTGPTVQSVSDVLSVFYKAVDAGIGDGDWGKIGAQAVRTTANMTPFANLFYTRGALDYLILYHLQEAMDPGAMRRLEERVARENNQRFLIRPTRVVGE